MCPCSQQLRWHSVRIVLEYADRMSALSLTTLAECKRCCWPRWHRVGVVVVNKRKHVFHKCLRENKKIFKTGFACFSLAELYWRNQKSVYYPFLGGSTYGDEQLLVAGGSCLPGGSTLRNHPHTTPQLEPLWSAQKRTSNEIFNGKNNSLVFTVACDFR